MTSIKTTRKKSLWSFISWITLAALLIYFHVDHKISIKQIHDQIHVLKPRQMKNLLEDIDSRLYEINDNLEYGSSGDIDEIKSLLYDIEFMIYTVRDEVETLNWNFR